MPQLALIAGGTGLEAASQYGQMQANDAAAKYNAAAYERQAQASRLAASYQASQISQQGDRVVGSERAIQAASGIDPGSGTAQDIQGYSASKAHQDALAAIYRGEVSAQQAQGQANFIQAMRPAQKAGALLGIGGTLLQGGAYGYGTYQGLYTGGKPGWR